MTDASGREAMECIFIWSDSQGMETNWKARAHVASLERRAALVGDDVSALIAELTQERDELRAEVERANRAFDSLRLALAEERAEVRRLGAESDAAYAAIGSVQFMDLPDGGSPTLAEQIAKMRSRLARAEKVAEVAVPMLERAKAIMLEREIGLGGEELNWSCKCCGVEWFDSADGIDHADGCALAALDRAVREHQEGGSDASE